MQRREFLRIFGGATSIAWPVAASSQEVLPIVGFLNTSSPSLFANYVQAYRHGLATAGYVEGRNVEIEYRWAAGDRKRLKELAADLVRRRVDVIAATGGSPAALEASAATSTIPIVFQVGVDPIKTGLVASLNRPGGNMTGATMLASDLGPKRLEVLRELVPRASSFIALLNPTTPTFSFQMTSLKVAANTLGLRLHVLRASDEKEFEAAFKSITELGGDALYIGGDPMFNEKSAQLADLALQYRIPTGYQFREFAAAGGLMSYGGSITDAYYQAGIYTGRVLKGDKPADLPIQQTTRVELIVNLKTAKTLGISVPLTLLGRADEIIE